ncbi:MAG: hypothetical protein IJQ71_01515 [Clostridia bacterium]|nr:hypothetical protein [Clostridia bacterium]
MDRLIQILPDRFDLLHKGRAAPLFHLNNLPSAMRLIMFLPELPGLPAREKFYFLAHGLNAPWYQNARAGSFCNYMKSFNITMSQEVGSIFFG